MCDLNTKNRPAHSCWIRYIFGRKKNEIDAWQSPAWACQARSLSIGAIWRIWLNKMLAKAERVVRPAQTRLQNSGVTGPKFIIFLPDVERSPAVLTRASMLQSSLLLWNASTQYCQFLLIRTKNQLPWQCPLKDRGKDQTDRTHPCTYLSGKFGEDRSCAFWDNWSQEQEALLLQRDRATRYVSNFVLCFKRYENYKRINKQKWLSRLFKGNGAIPYATYDFLLVFHCNYVSILHRWRNIIIYFPKFKDVTWLWSHPFRVIYHACTTTPIYQLAHEVSSV